MRGRVATFVLVAMGVLLVGLAGPALADADDIIFVSSTEMNGANERPTAGDVDGSGTADILTIPSVRVLCWIVFVDDIILPAQASHVHLGSAAVAGPVVVGFAPPNRAGVTAGCTRVNNQALIDNIAANPDQYYVNIHTTDFPGGAVRGQLEGD